jgi:hypothetical protein
LQGDKNADDGLFAVEDADEVAYVARRDFARFDLDDDGAGGFAFAFEITDEAVNTCIFRFSTHLSIANHSM